MIVLSKTASVGSIKLGGNLVVRDGLNLSALPAFLRVLLTTDGTVTKSLEAFFWEPVAVRNRGQEYHILTEAVPLLRRPVGSRLLRRRVDLVGVESGRLLVWADSWINTELLSPALRTELEAGQVGIGELLRECGLETYRQIVDCGCEPEAEGGECVWRRYIIVQAGQPFIQIQEFFPLMVYREGE